MYQQENMKGKNAVQNLKGGFPFPQEIALNQEVLPLEEQKEGEPREMTLRAKTSRQINRDLARHVRSTIKSDIEYLNGARPYLSGDELELWKCHLNAAFNWNYVTVQEGLLTVFNCHAGDRYEFFRYQFLRDLLTYYKEKQQTVVSPKYSEDVIDNFIRKVEAEPLHPEYYPPLSAYVT